MSELSVFWCEGEKGEGFTCNNLLVSVLNGFLL